MKMGVRDVMSLVKFETRTDKLVEVVRKNDDGDKDEKKSVVRSFIIDFNPKKTFMLLAAYLTVVNATLPTALIELLKTL